MDPFTHTLTGLALSRAGLKRWFPYATPVLLLAANAPDIDVVTAAGGTPTYLEYHRHITHSLIAAPFMAILPALVVRLFARKEFDWRRAYVVSLVGVASHPLLDFTNIYGIRLLLPFSGEWLWLGIFNIVDIWIWAVLLLVAVAPAFSRLVSSEIGAKPGSGRGLAIAALVFLVAYGFGRFLLRERAMAVLDARLYDGRPALRVAALPGAVNPFQWTGLVETERFYSLHEVNVLAEFDPTAGRVFYKAEPGPREQAAAAAARQTQAFRVFLDFAHFPIWRFLPADEPEGAMRVELTDMRFGPPQQRRFTAWAVVDPAGRVVDSDFAFNVR